MKKSISRFLSFLLLVTMIIGFFPIVNQSVAKAENQEEESVSKAPGLRPMLEEKLPLYGGYYRTWHDVTSIGIEGQSNEGKIEMDKIPSEVDLVFVFDDWQAEDSPYYDKLKTEYAKKLQEQGTYVIRTIGTEFLYGANGIAKNKLDIYTNDEEGYKKLAEDIVQTYVLDFGLNGLDIDVENHNYHLRFITEEQRERIHGVFKELGKLIGPNGKHENILFIYDTTLGTDQPVFQQNYQNFDLVLLQVYGITGEVGVYDFESQKREDSIEDRAQEFSKYIPLKKLMYGFSFYEENGTKDGGRWYDVPSSEGAYDELNQLIPNGTIRESRAGRYAKWQPSTELKGGIFGYAVERDGVYHPTKKQTADFIRSNGAIKSPSDYKLTTEFNDSKILKNIMTESGLYRQIDESDFPDAALLNEIRLKVSKFSGDLALFNKELVLDNPEIKDLTGLKSLTNVKKITLKGLEKLESLSSSDLPESFINESKAPESKAPIKLELTGLSGLTSLDLSGMNLEQLSITDSENFRSLKSINISDNMLDLSPGTQNRIIVDNFLKALKNNSTEITESSFNIKNQRPQAYYPKSYSPSFLRFNSNESVNLKDILNGVVTAGDYFISDESKFEEFKNYSIENMRFVDENLTYKDFIQNIRYSEYEIKVLNNKFEEVEVENFILKPNENDVNQTYTVEYRDIEKNLVHTLKIVYGEGSIKLTKISEDIKNFFGLDHENVIKKAFDGVIHSVANQNSFSTWNAPGWFAIELDPSTTATYWKLYQNSHINGGNKSTDIESGSLEYIADLDVKIPSGISKDKRKIVEFLNNQEWTAANSFEGGTESIYSSDLSNIKARYWRFKFNTVTGGNTSYGFPTIPEIEIFGIKLDSSELMKVINEVTSIDKSKYTEESVFELYKVLAEVEGIFEKENLVQSDIDNARDRLRQAIMALVEVENKPDKSELVKEIEKAKRADLSNITEESKKILEDTIAKAEMLNDSEYANSKEIEKMIQELKEAVEGLKKIQGFVNIDGKQKYIKEDGSFATGWLTLDEDKYYFNEEGVMHIGWLTKEGKTYVFKNSGKMVVGWRTIAGNRYYFNEEGVMHKGWLTKDGKTYVFKNSGKMVIGWRTIAGKRYYFNQDGSMHIGWLKLNNKTYLFYNSGKMVTGEWKSSGKTYYFNKNGELIKVIKR
ncbi:MAG: hypothetical protein Q4A42_04025 [Tissierellia bacterium]|nr:hypothetical protein [Tissierellia bacterium]